jgi:hypothetical protein
LLSVFWDDILFTFDITKLPPKPPLSPVAFFMPESSGNGRTGDGVIHPFMYLVQVAITRILHITAAQSD